MRHEGEVLKELMEKSGVSQRWLANASGVDRGFINSVLAGKVGLSFRTARKLALPLRVHPGLFFGPESGEPSIQTLKYIMGKVQERFEDLDNALCCHEVPIRGAVPCGIPGLEQEQIEGHVSIPKGELDGDPKAMYVVRATGHCLSGDGIQDGDLLLVDPNAEFVNGKIYVVRLADGFVARHVYRKEQGKLRLEASTPPGHSALLVEYGAIEPEQAQVEGRVILSGSEWRKH